MSTTYTYMGHPVSEIILATSPVQIEGATGDSRVCIIIFSDSTVAINVTIEQIKIALMQAENSVTSITNQSINVANKLAIANALVTNNTGLVSLVSTL